MSPNSTGRKGYPPSSMSSIGGTGSTPSSSTPPFGGMGPTPSRDFTSPGKGPGGTGPSSDLGVTGGRGGTRPSSVTKPCRKRPVHPPVVEVGNRAIIVFLTVCTKDRATVLDNQRIHNLLVAAWRTADRWRVGWYVIMPDHVHLFCAPGTWSPGPVNAWVSYWKGLVARAVQGLGPLAPPPSTSSIGGTGSTPSRDFTSPGKGPGGTGPSSDVGVTAGRGVTRPSGLWQRDSWDTHLRQGDSYSAKWDYVRANPVRAGLCRTPEEWPFQGIIEDLAWYDP
jgi:REP element-mobilizing transposase RayT